MGNCWDSPAKKHPTPGTTENHNSDTSQTSKTTSTTSSSNASNKSQFSASSSEEEVYSNGLILPTPNLREFTFQELKSAARNFKVDALLGEGGFGKVYKGWLDTKHPTKSGTGLVVAIKKLDPESLQGLEEWQSEINFLGRLSHPNLVKLLGYCLEDEELLLVYEFMQRGSLENHLFGRGSLVQPLPWGLRIKIAIGAARGLAFLHSSDDRVIYRDIKASNILLDGNYNAKISDFGLAKLGPSASKSHITTKVMGTYGYVAPEYIATGHLSVKSDVYGFGVVLAELLTAEQAVDRKRPNGKQNLIDWIKPHLSNKRKLKNIMDIKLEGKYSLKAAVATAELALKCMAQEPKARPTMQGVLQTLVKIEAMDLEKPKVPRRSMTDSAIRPHGHPRQNGIKEHHKFIQSR